MSELIAEHSVTELPYLDSNIWHDCCDKVELLLTSTAAHKYCIQKPMPAPFLAHTF